MPQTRRKLIIINFFYKSILYFLFVLLFFFEKIETSVIPGTVYDVIIQSGYNGSQVFIINGTGAQNSINLLVQNVCFFIKFLILFLIIIKFKSTNFLF